jgi:hypothetical protein
LLATLIDWTLAEISPDLVLTTRENTPASAERGTARIGWEAAARDLLGTLPVTAECGPEVLHVQVGLGGEGDPGAAGEAATVIWCCCAWLSRALFREAMDAATNSAAPTTPTRRSLRITTTTS